MNALFGGVREFLRILIPWPRNIQINPSFLGFMQGAVSTLLFVLLAIPCVWVLNRGQDWWIHDYYPMPKDLHQWDHWFAVSAGVSIIWFLYMFMVFLRIYLWLYRGVDKWFKVRLKRYRC